GQPGGDPGGWWDPSHVVVHDGMVELQNYQDPILGNRWVSGGLSSASAPKQTFGKYLVRFRMDKGNGIAGIALLWPSSGGWPAESDRELRHRNLFKWMHAKRSPPSGLEGRRRCCPDHHLRGGHRAALRRRPPSSGTPHSPPLARGGDQPDGVPNSLRERDAVR